MNFHHPHCDVMPIACAGCEIDGLRNELAEKEFKHRKVVDSLHAQMRERRKDYIRSLKCMAETIDSLLTQMEGGKNEAGLASGD